MPTPLLQRFATVSRACISPGLHCLSTPYSLRSLALQAREPLYVFVTVKLGQLHTVYGHVIADATSESELRRSRCTATLAGTLAGLTIQV